MASVTLFNKGKRTIHGHVTVGDEKAKYALEPEKALVFDEAEANRLRGMYPNEVISMEDVAKAFTPPAPKAEPKPKANATPKKPTTDLPPAVPPKPKEPENAGGNKAA